MLDEQPLLRQGISDYLNSQPDMMVCGEAESIWDAQSKIAECQPQVLVTALRLGVEDSLKLIKKLKSEMPRLRILVYSAFEESVFAERAMRVGASGYVMTLAPIDTLVAAIREVARGGIYVSREVALNAYRKSLQQQPKNDRRPRSAARIEQLSAREMHIFRLLGSGLLNRQIAASLDLSVKTVENHQENIKRKLYLTSCADVRKRAAKWVERSLSSEKHIFRADGRERKTKLPPVSSPVAPSS